VAAAEEPLPLKVAILPFVNRTSTPEAGTIVRKMFYNFFSSLNYLDIEPSLIDAQLKSAGIYQAIAAGESISPRKIGQVLGVDAVVFGEVTGLGKLYALVYADNQAGLMARMIGCATGRPVWELEHSVHLQEGDVPLSLTGLAATIVMTAISHQQATHMKAAAELCLEMVATIPNPPAVTETPPKIKTLVHNAGGHLLEPGDQLKIALIGDRHRRAGCSLPPLLDNLPLKEKEPGVYIGSYRIQPEDRLPHGRLVGYLETESGVRSQWVDTIGPIKIGIPTILPEVIGKDTVLSADRSPYLVERTLLVNPGAKLTVEAGTVIWFRGLGLIVKGTLQIFGTETEPVRFSSPASSSWKGVFIDHSRTDNEFQYCHISNAEFGIRAADSSVSIRHCLFQDNLWGIVLENGVADIQNSLVRTASKTGIAARGSDLTIRGSVITENTTGGLLLQNPAALIEQNNISNNGGWSLKVIGNPDRLQAANNWWGTNDPATTGVIGAGDVQPVLKNPIRFDIIE
jgi:hypothetical protein